MSDAAPFRRQQTQWNLIPILPLIIPPQSNDSPESILQNIPQKKRRRGRRSCNACRQRRMKCNADTVQPCSGCKQFGVECHFRDEKGPTNVIELFEDRVTRLKGLLKQTLDQRRADQKQIPVEKTETPAFSDCDIFAYRSLVSLNATLELVEQTNLLQPRDYNCTRYIGNSSGVQLLNPLRIGECYRITDERSFILQKINNSDDELAVVKAEDTPRSALRPRITQSIAILHDIPGLTEELVDLAVHAYFAFIQPNLPIVNKLSFLQQYYYQNPNPPDEYMLSAMCALGMDFLNFQDGFVVGMDISHDTVYSVKRHLGDKAVKILQVAYRRSQISTLQTLILLAAFLPLSNGGRRRGRFNPLAINMAQDLGLHRSSTNWNIPESEIELRRRIWYAMYIIDIWMAAELGRPTAISDDTFDVELPSVYEIDSIHHTISDDGDMTMSCPLLISQAELSFRKKLPEYGFFLHLALLSQTLRRVLSSLYPQRSYDVPQNNIEIINGLDAELGAWKSSLPVHLRFDEASQDDIILTGDSALLHVFYNCVMVVLHRPLLEDSNLFGTVRSVQSQSVCTAAALSIMYTIDALTASRSDYMPRSIIGYSVFQAARVFAFNASSENEYERQLGYLNVVHCAKSYIVDEVYTRNTRIVNQLTNLLAKLQLYKEITQLPDIAARDNEPTIW